MKHQKLEEQIKEEFFREFDSHWGWNIPAKDVPIGIASSLLPSSKEVREYCWKIFKPKLTQAIENYRDEVKVEKKGLSAGKGEFDKCATHHFNQALQEVANKDKKYFEK